MGQLYNRETFDFNRTKSPTASPRISRFYWVLMVTKTLGVEMKEVGVVLCSLMLMIMMRMGVNVKNMMVKRGEIMLFHCPQLNI